MRIFPAIDLSEGKAVRLTQGDFARKTIYREDPVALAQEFAAAGLRHLHVVDLDGARQGGPQNLDVLKAICRETDLKVDFGGGIRETAQIEAVFQAGAVQVTIGSMAARQPATFRGWIEQFGPEKFILGADARKGKIAVAGWQESTEISLEDFIAEYLKLGVRTVVCTAIERDGMLTGPDLKLYRSLSAKFPEMDLVASGGVSALQDLTDLADLNLYGAIVGKAFYEGRITLEELVAKDKASC